MSLTKPHDVNSLEPILQVKNIRKSFGGLAAVNNMSFTLMENEILGLIGPNGAGKTTVLNLISGTYTCDKGDIIFKGCNITRFKPYQVTKKGITKTFQLVRLLPSMTVLENVMAGLMFGRVKCKPSDIVKEAVALLQFVEYSGSSNNNVDKLTYIDRKKVELARALGTKPEVLLLDEFLAGLNPAELNIGINIVRKLQSNGITIILVEHVMKAVLALCNRVIVMSAGSKIAEGVPREILSNEEVIKAYLGDAYVKS